MNSVLDASAILAWILREPGSERVRELMATGNCLLSAVNAAEIITKLADKDRPETALRQVIAHIGAECLPFDAAQATEAGLLRPLTRDAWSAVAVFALTATALPAGAAPRRPEIHDQRQAAP